MTTNADLRLARLLQIASPTLPVGAYSYSQGLEAVVEAGIVRDAASAGRWIVDVMEHTVARMEAPILARMIEAWRTRDSAAVDRWNRQFLASRETAEFRAETVQMGYSLAKLLTEIDDARGLDAIEEISFPAAYAYAVAAWHIETAPALSAYLWAWCENQVMAALKAVPLGQTDGQRLLLNLGEQLTIVAERALTLTDDELGSYAPRLAILSSQHETQYSRLFRS